MDGIKSEFKLKLGEVRKQRDELHTEVGQLTKRNEWLEMQIADLKSSL